MEGAKRRIHRLRNSISGRPSSTEVGHQDGHALLNSNDSPTTLSESRAVPQDDAQNDQGEEKGAFSNLPKLFVNKKQRILEELAMPEDEYSDKSPKGSVDEGVRELIDLVNGNEGWVTTSSCAGRVSVFVEGKRDTEDAEVDSDDTEVEAAVVAEVVTGEDTELEGVEGAQDEKDGDERHGRAGRKIKTGAGGKGGGRWLYVSHDPIATISPAQQPENSFMTLFGLQPMTTSGPVPRSVSGQLPRLIHLTFSPLILHVLTATLHHARPLLAAAINAGFRESGVQSLKALDDEEAGVTIGIRTAGLVFETVIGVVVEDENGEEKMQAVASEEYLQMCVDVISERFEGNEKRKERLMKELERVVAKAREEINGETEEDRRRRKKEAGLRRQEELQDERSKEGEKEANGDVLEGGLDITISK